MLDGRVVLGVAVTMLEFSHKDGYGEQNARCDLYLSSGGRDTRAEGKLEDSSVESS